MRLIKKLNLKNLKNKRLLWTLASLVFMLTIIDLHLILKYEVVFFRAERFLHQDAALEAFEFHWPEDKRMALSLTFDDARLSQIDSGVPLLDKYGVKATFYVLLPGVRDRLNEWKEAAKNGHEIGNHTINHPCSGNYDWRPVYGLENYTMTRMFNELNIENEVIKKLLGVYPKSFAYPCGQTYIGEGVNTKSYVPLVSSMFESGRLYSGGTVHPVFCDLAKLPSSNLDNKQFDEIKQMIEEAKKTGKWLILTGHDIGDGNNSQTSLKNTIEAICIYAKDPSNGIWIDNVHHIASYIKEQRCEEPFSYISEYKTTTSSIYGKILSVIYIWRIKLGRLENKIFQETGH
jgi:peptidoglycan-N-acetylglucosamine deacetylase